MIPHSLLICANDGTRGDEVAKKLKIEGEECEGVIDQIRFLSAVRKGEKVDVKRLADVYKYNPYCKAVAKRLHSAQDKVFQELQ